MYVYLRIYRIKTVQYKYTNANSSVKMFDPWGHIDPFVPCRWLLEQIVYANQKYCLTV